MTERREKSKNELMEKQKIAGKFVDFNPTMSILMLNITDQENLLKNRNHQIKINS